MRPPPRLVLAPGVYRSASTWAANVIAELLRLAGPASLLYADSAAGIATEIGAAPRWVVKMHQPDPSMLLLAHLSKLPVVMTVRDPGDCVVSLMEQFHEPFERAALGIASSARLMLAMLDVCEPLILRYETEARDAAAVARIAAFLDITVDDAQAAAIAATLDVPAVGAFIDDLMTTGYFGDTPQIAKFHRETHWHPRHLGSGASGRRGEVLGAEQIAAVDGATQAYRRVFGYLRAGE